MKFKRTERIGAIVKILSDNPNKIYTLSYFTETFNAAKSTISEDLLVVKNVFEKLQLGKVITISEESFYYTNRNWYEFMMTYLKDQFDLDANVYMFSDFLEVFAFLHEVGHATQELTNNQKCDGEYSLFKNRIYNSYEEAFLTYRNLTLEKQADKFAVSFIKNHKLEIWSIMNDISIKEAEEESKFWETNLY